MAMPKGKIVKKWQVRKDGKYKECSRDDCPYKGQMLHESMFVYNRSIKAKYTSECKFCHAKAAQRWQQNNPEKYRAINQKWYRRNKHYARLTRQHYWRQRNEMRRIGHAA